MSITLGPAVSTLEVRAYFGMKKKFPTILRPILSSEECFFNQFNNEVTMPQFIDLLDVTDKFKNDFAPFIREVSSDYQFFVSFENISTGLGDTITDNTYGALRDFGDYPLRPDVWSFVVDWHKIHAVFGFGLYKFTFVIKTFGGQTIQTTESVCYRLMPFDCDLAHGTVRIETDHTNYIINGFDYRNLSSPSSLTATVGNKWVQQIRWYGRLFKELPDEENDFFLDSKRREQPIQQKYVEKFKLILKRLPVSVGNPIEKDRFFADVVKISDYNLNNYEFYRDKLLRKVSTDEIQSSKLNGKIALTWTLKETDESTVARKYG